MASGHVEKRSKDGWTVVIDYGYQLDPKTRTVKETRKQYSFRHVTKKWALQKLHDMLAEINKGSFVEPAETRVGDYLTEWHAHKKAAKRTLQGYKSIIENHVRPVIGAVRLAELQPDDLRALYAQLERKGLKDSSIRRVHVLLHSALGQALTDGKIYRNPADAVKLGKVDQPEKVALTRGQVTSALSEAASMGSPRPRDRQRWVCTVHDLLYVALNTGMRRGELLALRWEYVDLEEGVIDVQWTMNKAEGEIEIKAPKSRRSKRQIPLSQDTTLFLKDLRSRNPHELVFCHTDGSYLDPSTVSRIFRRIADKIGANEATFHSQRHTFVTTLIEEGADIATAQDLAGHEDIHTTRIYVHTVDARKRQAAELVSAALSKTTAQQSRSKSPEKQETQS